MIHTRKEINVLNEIIQNLKHNSQWDWFVKAFKSMQQDILDDMRNGDIKTIEDLKVANAKLDLLDRCISLDKYKGKGV